MRVVKLEGPCKLKRVLGQGRTHMGVGVIDGDLTHLPVAVILQSDTRSASVKTHDMTSSSSTAPSAAVEEVEAPQWGGSEARKGRVGGHMWAC
jgi:hypothetical protein